MADGVDDDAGQHHLNRREYSAWFRDAIKDDELAVEVEKMRVNAAAFPPRSSCQPETPSTNIAPVTKAASTVWENSAHSVEFRSTTKKSVSPRPCSR